MNANQGFTETSTEGGSFLAHIPSIIWQRKWLFIIPAVLGALAGVAAAYLLPTVYQSRSVILVQSPVLPSDVIGENAVEQVDRRIERYRQQVLSRPVLVELINKHGLYGTSRSAKPLSDVVEDMRDAVVIQPVSSEIQKNSNGQESNTIAFSLAYDYAEAEKAQKVALELTDQILTLDSTSTSDKAANAADFLKTQAATLQTQISALEQNISGIKARYGIVLAPGTTMTTDPSSFDMQISMLQQQAAQLSAQAQQANASSRMDPGVAAAQAELARVLATYSDNHPDVAMARQRLAEAKSLAAQNAQMMGGGMNVSGQIAAINGQIANLRRLKAEAVGRNAQIRSAQASQPQIMEMIAQQQSKLDGLNDQYQDVAKRLAAAEAGVSAEDQQLGERLSVIDPPVVPDEPVSPNRPLLSLGGVAAGLALGLLLVFGTELFMRPIRDPATLTHAIGEAPLVVIPTIRRKDEEEKFASGKGRWWWPFGRKKAAA